MMDPVNALAAVVALAKERQVFGDTLTRVRRVTERDEETLKRLISERDYVIGIIDRHFEGRDNPFKESGEHGYKRNLMAALEHVVLAGYGGAK